MDDKPYVVGVNTDRGAAAGRVHVLTTDARGVYETVAVATSEQRAAFIVQACNAHDELVAALQEAEAALYRLNGSDDLPGWCSGVVVNARAALAKAGAK